MDTHFTEWWTLYLMLSIESRYTGTNVNDQNIGKMRQDK